MTNLLLLLILICNGAIIFILNEILKRTDFSKEDAQVKAMTEQIREAKNKLPKQEK